MPSLSYIKLTDKLACQASPTVYGVLRPGDFSDGVDIRAVEDEESLLLRYPRVDASGAVRAITAQMRSGRVLTEVWNDATIDEWRVGPVEDGRGQGGLITVHGVPLALDLADRADSSSGKGWVSSLVNGVRVFDFTISEKTAAEIWSTYILPACPSHVTAGTVTPSIVIPSLIVSRLTPWALALAVRDALRRMDVTCELDLRRNGTTDYQLDLVAQIGSSATTPVFHPRASLASLKRRTDPTLQATRILVKGAPAPDTLPGILGRSRWRGAAPSGNTIALTDRNGGNSPIGFDDQWVGNVLLRVKTGRTFLVSDSVAATGVVTLDAISTIAADEDFEFRLTEPLSNTRTTTTRYAISAVGGGTITCGASNPISADNQYVDWYARVWDASSGGSVILTTRVSASVAASDVLTVASIAGVTTAHFVEFIQLDGAGELPAYIDHPTYAAADPTGYGIKVKELTRDGSGGAVNLMPNSWMRTWTTGANPPDGWVKTGGGAVSRNSDPLYTRYGGYSYRFTPSAASSVFITTPVAWPNWAPGITRLSVRAWVYFTTYTSNLNSILTVYAATASGGLGASLGNITIQPSDGSNAAVKVVTGAWVELRIEGVTLGPATAPYGILVQWDAGGTASSNTVDGYLDTVECYPFPSCPAVPQEFGDAMALLQSGNNDLRLVATPPVSYELEVRDLERAFPADYPRLKLTRGGNVRAADIEYGIDPTVRLLRMERDLKEPTATRLTLANRRTLFTDMALTGETTPAATAANAVAEAIAALPPAFISVAAGATLTLTSGAAVAVAAGTLVAVVDGSSATFVGAGASPISTKVKIGTP